MRASGISPFPSAAYAFARGQAPCLLGTLLAALGTLLAALFGYLLLHEVLTARQLLGCALILAAIVVVQFKEAARP